MRSSQLKLLLVSMLAVFAVSAVASASASATCYRVAPAGAMTGNRDSSCTTNVGPTKKEYIHIAVLETRLKPGEWCAKVEEAGVGTFSNSACTETTGAKEYIKVLVPEFVHCIKTEPTKDEYPTKEACVKNEKKGEEPREWDRVAVAAGVGKLKFTDASGVSFLRAGAGAAKVEIECKKDKSTGEITGATTVGNLVVTYEECTGKTGSGAACALANIKTNKVKGTLGPTSIGTEVGEELVPESGTEFVKIPKPSGGCIVETAVTGGVIQEVTPINKLQEKGESIFTETSEKQTIRKLGSGTEIFLKAFGSPARLVSTDVITFEERVEVT